MTMTRIFGKTVVLPTAVYLTGVFILAVLLPAAVLGFLTFFITSAFTTDEVIIGSFTLSAVMFLGIGVFGGRFVAVELL